MDQTPNNQNLSEIKFCVIGGGQYGSAMAYVLQEIPENKIQFLVRNEEQAEEINIQKTSKKVNELIKWNENVSATTSIEEALEGAKYVFLVIPAQTLPNFLEENFDKFKDSHYFVNCSKGKISFF